MSFNLFYNVPGRHQRFVELPDFYIGFVSTEDASQLRHGLNEINNNEPAISTVRQSVIQLAKQRKDGENGKC